MTKESEKSRKALMNILEDVQNAQKKAEEEKNKTLAIITNFTDGLLVFDKKNKLSLINPQAQNFLGISSKKIIGKSISELTGFSALNSLFKTFEGANKNAKKVFRKEFSLKKDSILEISTLPIIREKEKLGFLIILHDITREKIIEKAKSDFVSLAAHQLRMPLSGIKWGISMLLEEDFGKLSKEQKDTLRKIYYANERIVALTNDLLNVIKIEEGKLLYNLTKKDIVEITKKTIDILEEIIQERGIKIEFLVEKKIPKVKVDEEKISFCIQNLIENAIIYNIPKGNVKIILKYDEIKKEVLFSVRDTGIGVLKEEQKKLFTKFFRGSLALKKETVGSGLGLFVAKNIIEAHGGKIWFESEGKEKGSTFYFSLPIR